MLQQNRVGGFRFSADLCFRSMLGPLWATDMHTPGLTLKLQKTLSLFRHVRRVSVLRFFPPHPRDVPPQLRARCERAQLRRREQARPVIPATRQGVRRRDARPVDHRSTNQERTPIAAHEGVLAGGIEALCEHAPAPGALGSVVVPVSVVRVPHAGSTLALTLTDTAWSGAPVGWWPR